MWILVPNFKPVDARETMKKENSRFASEFFYRPSVTTVNTHHLEA